MNKSTSKDSYDYSIPYSYLFYVAQGSFILLSNGLVVGAIAKYKQMRRKKEYIVVAGLALADALNGCTYLVAGSTRIALILLGYRNEKMSPWQCVTTFPHPLMFWFTDPLSGIMLACVSIDRLLAVSVPLKYYKMGTKYAFKLVGIFYVVNTMTTLGMAFNSYKSPRDFMVSTMCKGFDSMGVSYFWNTYYYFVRVVAGVASVALYMAVPVIYRRHMRRAKNRAVVDVNQNSSQYQMQLRTQLRLIVTMGMATVATLCFYVSANLVRAIGQNYKQPAGPISKAEWSTIIFTMSVLQNVNPMVNTVLYMARHRDIRDAIVSLVMCKRKLQMPQTVTTKAGTTMGGSKLNKVSVLN